MLSLFASISKKNKGMLLVLRNKIPKYFDSLGAEHTIDPSLEQFVVCPRLHLRISSTPPHCAAACPIRGWFLTLVNLVCGVYERRSLFSVLSTQPNGLWPGDGKLGLLTLTGSRAPAPFMRDK